MGRYDISEPVSISEQVLRAATMLEYQEELGGVERADSLLELEALEDLWPTGDVFDEALAAGSAVFNSKELLEVKDDADVAEWDG